MDKCCGISATELLNLTLSYVIWVFDCAGFKFSWKQHRGFGSGYDSSAQTEESRWQLPITFLFACFYCVYVVILYFAEFVFFQACAFPQ